MNLIILHFVENYHRYKVNQPQEDQESVYDPPQHSSPFHHGETLLEILAEELLTNSPHFEHEVIHGCRNHYECRYSNVLGCLLVAGDARRKGDQVGD